jgi:hypothetical protein
VDATADQYQNLWLGDVVTVDPSTPMAANYLHAPRQWEIRISRRTVDQTVDSVRCVSGNDAQVLSPDNPGGPWLSLARGILRVVTGWELNDELVGLAARALRAKVATAQAASTEDLIRPLLTASIQHLGRQGTQPWIAAEFLEPL